MYIDSPLQTLIMTAGIICIIYRSLMMDSLKRLRSTNIPRYNLTNPSCLSCTVPASSHTHLTQKPRSK